MPNPDNAQLWSAQIWKRVQAPGPTALAGALEVEAMEAICAAGRTGASVAWTAHTGKPKAPPASPRETGGRGDLTPAGLTRPSVWPRLLFGH
jgi:hypothetical protein